MNLVPLLNDDGRRRESSGLAGSRDDANSTVRFHYRCTRCDGRGATSGPSPPATVCLKRLALPVDPNQGAAVIHRVTRAQPAAKERP